MLSLDRFGSVPFRSPTGHSQFVCAASASVHEVFEPVGEGELALDHGQVLHLIALASVCKLGC